MSKDDWDILETVTGDFQAEIIRGLLEANDIPVVMIQEGIGKSVYPVVVGPLANVQILVPKASLQQAHELLNQYYSSEDSEKSDD